MDSTRPIRALVRGLDALTFLNSRDGATASEIADAVSLPRTTMYRILDTFCAAGYVMRGAADERFQITAAVRRLSEGSSNAAWITDSVLPVVEQLGRVLVWPVCFWTRMATTMVVRATSEHDTPLATDRLTVGCRVPLEDSVAGDVYLAFAEIEAQGYALQREPRYRTESTTLAIPVPLAGHDAGVLSLRFLASAVPLHEAPERFVPKMRRSAARISHHYEQQRNAGGPAGPTAALF